MNTLYILNPAFPCCQYVYIKLHTRPLDGMLIATELAELKKITQFLLNTLYISPHTMPFIL